MKPSSISRSDRQNEADVIEGRCSARFRLSREYAVCTTACRAGIGTVGRTLRAHPTVK
jgi:hypothetical protein